MEGETADIVMTTVVVLIILGVGAFAFYIVNFEIGLTENQVETFTVTDPSVAKECTLTYPIESITSVQQYNGYSWVAISSAHYTVSGQTVTVLPSGMNG